MAAVTEAISLNSTAQASTYTTASFTPSANTLLVAMVGVTATAATGSMSDSLSGTWTSVQVSTKAASADKMWCFIRNTLAPASSMTVTMDVTGDAGTGCSLWVGQVTGMTLTGANAKRQTGALANRPAAETPNPSFAAACLTENPTLGFVFNASNPAGMTAPSGWTLNDDSGYNTPTTGENNVSRDSGFTGSQITWGSTSATAYGAIILELDTSVPASTWPGWPGGGWF